MLYNNKNKFGIISLIFFKFFMMNSNLSLFVWNCHRCANVKFPHIFREYNMDFRSNIVSILEPKVSGDRMDEIISKLRFHYSY